MALKRSWGTVALRGYRTWNVASYTAGVVSGTLQGLIESRPPWTSPTTQAVCKKSLPCGKPANPECSCGLYAWHVPDQVLLTNPLGVVEGAGPVVHCPFGWRATQTRIVAMHNRDTTQAEVIKSLYPEIKLYSSRDALLADWPEQIDGDALYGPQGKAARKIVRETAKITNAESVALNQRWPFQGTDEHWERQRLCSTSSFLRHRDKRPVTPSYVSRINCSRYGFVGVLMADRLTEHDYDVLVEPWRKEFGEPLPDFDNFLPEGEDGR